MMIRIENETKDIISFIEFMELLAHNTSINKETIVGDLYFILTRAKFHDDLIKNNSVFIQNKIINGFNSVLIVLVNSNYKTPKYIEIAGIDNLKGLKDFIDLNFNYKVTIDQISRDNIWISIFEPKHYCNFGRIDIISKQKITSADSIIENDKQFESVLFYFNE